jgi:type I restriction enzyme M protein
MSEENIKIVTVIPWLEGLGYKKEVMEFEQTITVQEGKKEKSIYADIVIYADKKKETPLIVVETKAPNEILSRSDREQVISYARLMPKIAPLAVLTNGESTQVYQTLDKTRIKEIPKKAELMKDFVGVVISKNIQEILKEEATKLLFTIDDVTTFKNLLKRCHNYIRNNEGYDPVQAFDELSKLLFTKMYEEQFSSENRFTLKTYNDSLIRLKVNIVQRVFEEIQKNDKFKDLFPPETKINLKDKTIEEIVKTFEKYDLTLTNFDVKGEAFEYFLSDTFTGGLGEYFTPRNVVEFMVSVLSPKIGEKIVDPFCGTGGFLIYAFDVVSEKIRLQDFSEGEKEKWKFELSNKSLFGTDWKPRTSQACKMNMIVHGDGNTGIFQHNGFINVILKKDNETIPIIIEDSFDICLTNPPFGATETDPEILNKLELGNGRVSQKREVLALERCVKLVKKKTGIIGIILPDGLLNNDESKYFREYINDNAELVAVIGLNKETFEGYNAQAKTSILFMRRKESPSSSKNQEVFMAVCQNSGYAPTGEQISGNQLPDILFDLKKYLTDKKHFEPIHPLTAIVKIENPGDRIDAERYISIPGKKKLEFYIDAADKLSSQIDKAGKLAIKVKESLTRMYTKEHFEYVPLSDLLTPCENKTKLVSETLYTQLGIRGNAGGVFIRKTSKGSKIKAKTLNQVESGWFVYSRLFAKNGSFAITQKEHVGGVFSNEFPTFKIKKTVYDDELIKEYLVFYLSSPQVLSYIYRLTTGSTKESRGRFKESDLNKLKIPIPKDPKILQEIVNSFRLIDRLKKDMDSLLKDTETLPKSFQISLPPLQNK